MGVSETIERLEAEVVGLVPSHNAGEQLRPVGEKLLIPFNPTLLPIPDTFLYISPNP